MLVAELIEQEGLEPEALIEWARARADALLTELERANPEDPLLGLVDGDVDADELAAASTPPAAVFTPLTEPSGLQPLAGAADLPPPPEPVVQAETEPEMLSTFDTGPVARSDADAVPTEVARARSADTVISPNPFAGLDDDDEDEDADDELGLGEDPEPTDADADEDGEEDELEELELDELVELDDDELVVLDEEPAEAPPPPPPPPREGDEAVAGMDEFEAMPVRTGDTATGLPVVDEPIRTGDTATGLPVLDDEDGAGPVQTGATASFPILDDEALDEDEGGEAPVRTGHTAAHAILDPDHDGDEGDAPVRTGHTAAHAVVGEDEPEEVDLDSGVRPVPQDDDFELDFDDL